MMTKYLLWFMCTIGLVLAATVSAQDKKTGLTTVTVREIELDIPESWKQVKTTSSMRVGQFEIPGKEAGAESAELVVFYFGGPTGGVKENVQRWIDQFEEQNREVTAVSGKWRSGTYVAASISGTWKKPIGPPFARKTVDKPGSRVIGVVLVTEKGNDKDYYFIKLSGPDKLVQSQIGALRTALGADVESERAFDLE